MSKQLILALSKGRILEETLPLLADAGITPAEDLSKSRKLLFDTNLPDVKLVIIRATDVPTYVQLGAADVGIAGKDVLLEHGVVPGVGWQRNLLTWRDATTPSREFRLR